MRSSSRAAALPLLAGALLLPLAAQADNDTAAIRTIYQNFQKMIRGKNVMGMLKYTTPDFQSMPPSGKPENAEESIRGFQGLLDQMKTVTKATVQVDKLAVKGSEANATVTVTVAGMLIDSKGEMGPKGKSHQLLAQSREQYQLVKTAGQWKARSLKLIVMKQLIDGKPMPPSPGAK